METGRSEKESSGREKREGWGGAKKSFDRRTIERYALTGKWQLASSEINLKQTSNPD
jgi:hypothetical protein